MNIKGEFSTSEEGIKKVSDIIIGQIINRERDYKINDIDDLSVIFLAGAPGSGKTEFIKSILESINFFFIDIDSYRDYFKTYKGNNSKDFQRAISGVLNNVLKYCFKNDIKFILDGTFKSLDHVKRNIDNCKRKKRKVQIYFIHQNPYISYYYTFLRELDGNRNIPVNGFVECYYKSIENIFYVKEKHKLIDLYICEKTTNLINPFGKKGYKIHDNIKNLTIFCKKYNIGYNGKEFINYSILKNGINDYNKNLKIILPILMGYLFLKKILGLKKLEK